VAVRELLSPWLLLLRLARVLSTFGRKFSSFGLEDERNIEIIQLLERSEERFDVKTVPSEKCTEIVVMIILKMGRVS
jgi:hypothetical protein